MKYKSIRIDKINEKMISSEEKVRFCDGFGYTSDVWENLKKKGWTAKHLLVKGIMTYSIRDEKGNDIVENTSFLNCLAAIAILMR